MNSLPATHAVTTSNSRSVLAASHAVTSSISRSAYQQFTQYPYQQITQFGLRELPLYYVIHSVLNLSVRFTTPSLQQVYYTVMQLVATCGRELAEPTVCVKDKGRSSTAKKETL